MQPPPSNVEHINMSRPDLSLYTKKGKKGNGDSYSSNSIASLPPELLE